MRIDLNFVDGVDKAVIVSFIGMWKSPQVMEFNGKIQQIKPHYLIVDPTEMIIPSDISSDVNESSVERKSGLNILVELMREEKMRYILINPNNNPVFASTKQHFIDMGVIEQFTSVNTKEEALNIVMQSESEK